jgi:hypothetical protein
MKKIYLTFDIETIVSGISRSENYLSGVYLASMFIAKELKIRDLKGTFFISLSSKQLNIDQNTYSEFIKWLLFSLSPYDNIKIEPHIHALNLPVSFECNKDGFDNYNFEQQTELLIYSKNFFKEQGINVNSFRPGGFKANKSYYESLAKAGFENSSILHKDKKVNINMITDEIFEQGIFKTDSGVIEYPVTSVKLKSIKGKTEILNLSPDFFRLSSVENYFKDLNYININFHSFSVYLNRLLRENHKGLVMKNISFLFFENILNKLLKFTSIQTLDTKTTLSNELLNWLDYIKKKKHNTFFIGE